MRWSLTKVSPRLFVSLNYLTSTCVAHAEVHCFPTYSCTNPHAGVPLSLFGFVAYSTVLVLSQLVRTSQESSRQNPSLSKWLLLAATSAMAAASGYFMYILNFKLTGASCTYCVGSAILSTSLLVATLTVSLLEDWGMSDETAD